VAITRTQMMARRIARENPDIDSALPFWARRNNPIVRRQLGMYWRVFPPQIRPIVKWTLIQSVVVLATIQYPLLFIIILTFLLAALMLLPYAFFLYVKTLGQIIDDAATAMVDEFKNETMTLLRTTPLSTMEILLSKIAASVWRRIDEMDQVLYFGLALGMPPIVMFYLGIWPPDESPILAQFMTVIMFISTLVRIPLEMIMAASVAASIGIATRVRSSAFLATAIFLFFYFLILNLMRLLSLNPLTQMFVDSILPIILPILLTWGSIRLSIHLITRD